MIAEKRGVSSMGGVVAVRTPAGETCPVLDVPFQNIRIHRHSAFTLSQPDGTAAQFAFG